MSPKRNMKNHGKFKTNVQPKVVPNNQYFSNLLESGSSLYCT